MTPSDDHRDQHGDGGDGGDGEVPIRGEQGWLFGRPPSEREYGSMKRERRLGKGLAALVRLQGGGEGSAAETGQDQESALPGGSGGSVLMLLSTPEDVAAQDAALVRARPQAVAARSESQTAPAPEVDVVAETAATVTAESEPVSEPETVATPAVEPRPVAAVSVPISAPEPVSAAPSHVPAFFDPPLSSFVPGPSVDEIEPEPEAGPPVVAEPERSVEPAPTEPALPASSLSEPPLPEPPLPEPALPEPALSEPALPEAEPVRPEPVPAEPAPVVYDDPILRDAPILIDDEIFGSYLPDVDLG